MFTRIDSSDIDIFNKPARVIIAGFSNSGKSFFTSKLLQNYKNKFDKIILYGSELENSEGLEIEHNEGYDPFSENISKHTLLIFDDTIFNKALIKLAAKLFTKGRHINCSTIFITQNIFLKDNDFRIISLNATHVFLFPMRDLNQIKLYGSTLLSKTQLDSFVNLYQKLVLKKKYGYLMIDFTQSYDSPLRLRSNILGEERFEKAYLL